MNKLNINCLVAVSLRICLLLASLGGTGAWAGRPLVVDDANVNEQGAGHIEVWLSREAGSADLLNLAPAYAPIEGLEVGASVSRDKTARETLSAVQVKWRITSSQDDGCNVAAVFGRSRLSGGEGANYVNGLLSCNGLRLGKVHVNLGGIRFSDDSFKSTWGVALERDHGGFTAHWEWFGQQDSKPTLQLGLNTQLAKNLQLDGTLGRTGDETIYSLGFKLQF